MRSFFIPLIVLLVVFAGIFVVRQKEDHRTQVLGDSIIVTPFVSSKGTKLYVDGKEYQFIGINAYHLASLNGVNAGCGGEVKDLNGFFSVLRPNSTVRMWAFQGSMATNPSTKQLDWTALDRVVQAASQSGMKLILTLGEQAGTCDDGHWKDLAWYGGGYTKVVNDLSNGLTPLSYLDYIKAIVTRYKDSTTIAMWEPINEPVVANCNGAKGTGCFAKLTCNDEVASARLLRTFFDTVGETIKSIDKNHLVSSGIGGDGQCGAVYEDYTYVHKSPGIDVASYHDYSRDDQAMPGDQWNGLQKRLTQMKLIGKPLIVGEVGMLARDNTSGCVSYSKRKALLKAKMDVQFPAGVAGILPWALTESTSDICNYDIVQNDPTLTLLHDYPVAMYSGPDLQVPSAPTNLSVTLSSPTQVTLSWGKSSDNVGVVRYDIFRNSTYLSSTTTTTFINSNLTPGTAYSYHVKGKDAAGNNSGESNSVTILTPLY